jgi:hypothetical protein
MNLSFAKPKITIIAGLCTMFVSIVFIVVYFPIANVSAAPNEEEILAQPADLGAQSYNFRPGSKIVSVSTQSEIYDYRAHIFDSYFRENNSPLTGYGQYFVDACDKYGAPHDCLLMVAIAKAETDLCKTEGADLQKNCWGFGGSGPNRIVYPNYETSITEVTRRVMEGYGTRFFNDANNGKLYYCGQHCDRWGDVVNSYKYDINRFGIRLGYPSLI